MLRSGPGVSPARLTAGPARPAPHPQSPAAAARSDRFGGPQPPGSPARPATPKSALNPGWRPRRRTRARARRRPRPLGSPRRRRSSCSLPAARTPRLPRKPRVQQPNLGRLPLALPAVLPAALAVAAAPAGAIAVAGPAAPELSRRAARCSRHQLCQLVAGQLALAPPRARALGIEPQK